MSPKNTSDRLPVRTPACVYLLGMTISLCGFYFGFSLTGYNNFFDNFMQGKFGQTIERARYSSVNSLLNTFVTVGGLLCVLVSGQLLKRVRLKSIVVWTCLLHLAARVSILWGSLGVVYVCRFAIGFVICLNSFTCSLYIADLLPRRYLGFLGSCYVGFMSIGIIVAMFMKYPWTLRYWWAVTLIPAGLDLVRLALLAAVFRLESPRSLLREISRKYPNTSPRPSQLYYEQQHFDEPDIDTHSEQLLGTCAEDFSEKGVDTLGTSQQALGPAEIVLRDQRFKEHPQMQRYLQSMFEPGHWDAVVNDITLKFDQEARKRRQGSMLQVMLDKSYRRQLLIAVVVNALNQLTGINAINFYSKIIFRQLKFAHAETLTVFCGRA